MIPLFAVLAIGLGGAAQAQTAPIDTSGLTVKVLNPNVTKVDGTVLDVLDVKAIQNPAQTNVKIKGPDGGKLMLKVPSGATLTDPATKLKIKPPK
jgi:hypothetical protein